jgi:hypothetical protein
MKSEAKPEITELTFQKDADANAYRLLAPYAKGHNLMFFAQNDSMMVMPRQYAYDDAAGNPVYASGTGTGDGFFFDMQVTFSYADSTQNVVCHEVYGERNVWIPKYEGFFKTDFFGDNIEGVIYVNEDNANRYILKPFVDNEEGLIFTVEDDGRITFETTSTGYDHSTYGMILGTQNDTQDVYSHMEKDFESTTFYFSIKYIVDAGSWGTYQEVFTVTKQY